ncbi:hypothetical protein [Delftia sp.]|uniref:hypothetical protein n=1 Tax=Delftia sp. TaxID=1886637 RepID=UPI00259C95B0|nr:hypothetical protein [Delftia sp.]
MTASTVLMHMAQIPPLLPSGNEDPGIVVGLTIQQSHSLYLQLRDIDIPNAKPIPLLCSGFIVLHMPGDRTVSSITRAHHV